MTAIKAEPSREAASASPLPWVFDEGNGAGPDEKESLPCIADAHGNVIMQIYLDDPYESPRVAEKIAAMRVAVDAVNRGVPDGLLMRLLHERLSDYERIANSKLGLTDLGEHAHLAFKIFRDNCIAALRAPAGDEGVREAPNVNSILWVCEELAYWIDSVENSMHSDDDDRARVTEGRAAIAAALAPREAEPVELRSSPGSARDLAEELREYTAMKYAGDCKCGKCQLVPRALVERIYHTLNSTRGVAQAAPEPAAYRWRQPGNKHWIYDPTPEWIEDHKHEIELEALYTSPVPSTDCEGK